jgi:hypothetical protein
MASRATRNTLNEEKCDIWPGVASGVDRLATTRPYYWSTYVFVTRSRDPLGGLTFDDERLRSRTIGVQMIGDNADLRDRLDSLLQRDAPQITALLNDYHVPQLQELSTMTQRNSDSKADQDTPGRPNSGASRQQTQPDQGAQTGNSEVDSKDGHQPRNDHHVRNEK